MPFFQHLPNSKDFNKKIDYSPEFTSPLENFGLQEHSLTCRHIGLALGSRHGIVLWIDLHCIYLRIIPV